jgi:hypothetical protein
MTLLRCGWARLALIGALALGGAAGCAVGAPDRASDIQNLNAISDDIAAVTMTRSPTARARSPNLPTLFPRANQTSFTP